MSTERNLRPEEIISNPEGYETVKSLAKLLNVNKITIHRMIADGRIMDDDVVYLSRQTIRIRRSAVFKLWNSSPEEKAGIWPRNPPRPMKSP